MAGTEKKTAITSIYQKLALMQQELKAPKSETGRFGKHRNLEGILKELKPLLKKHDCTLVLDNEMVGIGDKNYVRAVARLFYVDKQGNIQSTAASSYAWEGDLSRGLDAPQVSGAASSYARKYALGGLFAIDDTADPDSHMDAPTSAPAIPASGKPSTGPAEPPKTPATAKQLETIRNMANERFTTKEVFVAFLRNLIKDAKVDNLTFKEASTVITALYGVEKLPIAGEAADDEPAEEGASDDSADN